MLYMGIDLHRKQLTVNLRNEAGEVLLRRQVSTRWESVRSFLADVQAQAQSAGGWMAILEVCGFHDWLVKLLDEYDCQEVVLVQAQGRSRAKTDHRDAQALAELLWINRQRLLGSRPLGPLRRITLPTVEDGENRQLTALRKRLIRPSSEWLVFEGYGEDGEIWLSCATREEAERELMDGDDGPIKRIDAHEALAELDTRRSAEHTSELQSH